MLGRLKGLLRNTLGDTVEIEADLEHDVRLASAVLLVEAVRADHESHEQETQLVERLVEERFGLERSESAALVRRAEEHADHAVALQKFTRQLVDALDEDERASIIGMLWRVIYADGKVDRWEEHMVRRVADLLYVPHAKFIQQKLLAQGLDDPGVSR